MSDKRILVAGIGNIFLGDDAFGVEVAQRLVGRDWPEGVRVADFGIRGFDLAYAILDGYDVTVLVDAVPRREAPGTLYLIEPDPDDPGLAAPGELETHGMDPVQVLRLVRQLGGQPKRVLVVGCEPETFGPEDEGMMGLSAPVAAAVDEAVRMVESLVEKLLRGEEVGQALELA
ncbi:MAG: hydrogenase maturation protease [Chloroflexia bacterium]